MDGFTRSLAARRVVHHKVYRVFLAPAGSQMKTVVLLVISNIFMTAAWYLHLKDTHRPIILGIFFSWAWL